VLVAADEREDCGEGE
jgi:carbonyl reductase 1